jgi:hypothetical protein
MKHFHPAILDRRPAPHETSGFQAIDQSGDIRGVARQRVGEPAHGQGAPWLDQVQDVALDRGEIEFGARSRQVPSLGKKELHEELPGPTAVPVGLIHRHDYT